MKLHESRRSNASNFHQLSSSFDWAFNYLILTYFFSLYSGGHLNPVVTLAMTIVRRLPLKLAPWYVVAQLLGGMIGAALAKVYKVVVLVVKITKSLPFK